MARGGGGLGGCAPAAGGIRISGAVSAAPETGFWTGRATAFCSTGTTREGGSTRSAASIGLDSTTARSTGKISTGSATAAEVFVFSTLSCFSAFGKGTGAGFAGGSPSSTGSTRSGTGAWASDSPTQTETSNEKMISAHGLRRPEESIRAISYGNPDPGPWARTRCFAERVIKSAHFSI